MSNEAHENIGNDVDYVQEAEQIVYNHNKISIENALKLNQQMQFYLNELKHEMEVMLDTCQQKYKQNTTLLEDKDKMKNISIMNSTFYFTGYPYFKDKTGNGPPLSKEFLKRRDKDGELFPMDLLDRRQRWLSRDKILLVQGVKKQALKYLQMKNRDKIRQNASKRCANDIATRLNEGLNIFFRLLSYERI